MFDSPISKSQMELVTAARAATTDYIQNGTDLTEAVVKAASALQPITSEHVRRICEMTYHDAYERMFAEKTGMYQYVSFDPPDAIRAAEMLDALQLGLDQQHNFDKLASMSKEEKKRKRRNTLGGAAIGGTLSYAMGKERAARKTIEETNMKYLGKGSDGKAKVRVTVPKGTKNVKQYLRDTADLHRVKGGLYGAIAGAAAGAGYTYATRNKEASAALAGQTKEATMPRKFQRMNTYEIWTKAASGAELPDSNPTRELQNVHRDLKDSISTVKSELYAAEHNEKLAMLDMVKQARAGLSAGHSMEQILHAAVSVVDATEPLMAKTAHDLCATIIEACADHQNSDFRKVAEKERLNMYLAPQVQDKAGLPTGSVFNDPFTQEEVNMARKALEANRRYADSDPTLGERAITGAIGGLTGYGIGYMARPFTGVDPRIMGAASGGISALVSPASARAGFRSGLNDRERMLNQRQAELDKEASMSQVNPNHPIPQKFKKLAEANIQRKHLEVTLDELNRNMDYFNEQLKNEFLR